MMNVAVISCIQKMHKEKNDETKNQDKSKKGDNDRYTNVPATGDNNFTLIILNLRYIPLVKKLIHRDGSHKLY